ncbi:MAG TPA: alkaline phosphatase family protein, partial [Kofleriaceae bacterium]|nr:alkaline phosphatase family protein [Kofleriaceae bacterium]
MLTRREALRGIGVAVGAAALGCGHEAQTSEPDASAPAPDAGAPPRPDAGPPDATPVTACTSTSSLTAKELLAGIDTFVVLMMENRSFDHYLGALRLVEGRAGVDGLTGGESNPAPDGSTVAVHPLDTFTPADPPHDWDPSHEQWNDGANDGFVKAHAGADQADVMGYYTRAQLPITYALADQVCVCQRWYASVMGPTWPNRFYLHCATSNGQKSNFPEPGLKSVFDQLSTAGISSKNYYHDLPWAAGGYQKLAGLATIETFFSDAQAGTLPSFAIIDPQFSGAGANDDHPSHDVRMGQALIASVVAAMAQSPQWARSLLVIT